MKIRYGIIAMFFLLPGFIPAAKAAPVTFEFEELCNVYWQYDNWYKFSTFNKSGLDVEDGNSTSVDIPVNVFCFGRPDYLSNSESFFNMTVENIYPENFSGNNLVLTNINARDKNEHYQIKVNLCAGQSAGGLSQLCVSTIGTPTSYVLPDGGDQKELVDKILGPSSEESTEMDHELCREHPDNCSSDYLFFYKIGKKDHPYRLQAHVVIPRQRQIAPGTYNGIYYIVLKGKLRAENFLDLPMVDMNISNVRHQMVFSLNVSSACQVTPPTDVILPEQMFSGKSETQDARAHVRCTYGTPYTVTFKGQNTDSTGTEYMTVSTRKNKIPYQILDSKGVPWGALGEKFTGTSENEAISFKVKTLPGENQPAGTYEDTVTMTVSYTDGT